MGAAAPYIHLATWQRVVGQHGKRDAYKGARDKQVCAWHSNWALRVCVRVKPKSKVHKAPNNIFCCLQAAPSPCRRLGLKGGCAVKQGKPHQFWSRRGRSRGLSGHLPPRHVLHAHRGSGQGPPEVVVRGLPWLSSRAAGSGTCKHQAWCFRGIE